MVVRGSKIGSASELSLRVIEGLRTAARRPNINGYQPHTKQELFHRSLARGKQFIGGNRSGKTVGGGTEAVFRATGRHPYRKVKPPPTYGRVCAVDFVQGVEKIVKPEIARWLPPSELLGGSWEDAYDKTLRTLYLANGSFIEFMSYDQDILKFAGTSRDWNWFDEEPPEGIFDECMMRLVDTGGDWWMTMTPVEGMTWTYDRIYERSNPNHEDYDPDLFVIEVESDENPHLNSGELDVLLSGMDEEEKSARRKGRYIQRGGLIYPGFDEKIHVVQPIIARDLPLNKWMHFEMMDHGVRNATAWHWMAVDLEGRKLVYDEYHQTERSVAFNAERIKEKRKELGIIPSYTVGDPSIRNVDPITLTSVHLAYIEAGIPIILGNNDFNAGSNLVRTGLGNIDGSNPTLFFTANNPHLIWEIKRYRFKLWANKKMDREKNPQEEPNKKDDHHMDAIRYGIASRPLKEDFSIPEDFSRPAGIGSVSPYRDRVDPGTANRDRVIVDEILGSEW